MALIKRNYIDEETLITAQNLNDIQDAVMALEDGLFTVDDDKSGSVITITDAAKRGFRSFNIYGRTKQNGTPTPEAPVDLVSAGNAGSINVSVAGKNLFQIVAKTVTLKGCTVTVNLDGSLTLSGTCTENTSMRLGTFSQVGTFILSGGTTSGQINQSYIVSVHDTDGNVYWSGRDSTFTNTVKDRPFDLVILAGTYNGVTIRPMIRHVNVNDDTYEPYKAQTLTIATPNGLPGIPVSSGGNYTDKNGQQWICDEIDFARGVYVQRVYKLALNTMEQWRKTDSNAIFQVTTLLPYNSKWIEGLCTHFRVMKWYNTSFNPYIRLVESGKQVYFEGDVEEHTTVEDWTSFLAEEAANGTPVELLYVLDSPIETPLSEEERKAYAALYTYKDVATISNDAGAHMDLEYVMDTKKYIDGILKVEEAPRYADVILPAAKWTGTGSLYSQVVSLPGVTANSQVNLTPTVQQMTVFYEKDITFITENDGGVVTVYVIGQKPQNDYTIPAKIVEVRV